MTFESKNKTKKESKNVEIFRISADILQNRVVQIKDNVFNSYLLAIKFFKDVFILTVTKIDHIHSIKEKILFFWLLIDICTHALVSILLDKLILSMHSWLVFCSHSSKINIWVQAVLAISFSSIFIDETKPLPIPSSIPVLNPL